MKRSLAFLGLAAWLAAAAWAQDGGWRVTGVAFVSTGRVAVVVPTSRQAYPRVVAPGDRLDGQRVTAIGPDGLALGSRTLSFPGPPADPRVGTVSAGRISCRFEGARALEVLKLLAAARGWNAVLLGRPSPATIAGTMVDQPPQQVLTHLVSSFPEGLSWRVAENTMLVGPPALLARVPERLQLGTGTKTRVSLDYAEVDLLYVLSLLSQEMGRGVAVAPEVQGTVTCTLRDFDTEKALALCLLAQERFHGYRLVDRLVVVGPPDRLAGLPVSPPSSGRKITLQLTRADLPTALAAPAEALGLSLHLAPGLTGSVTLRVRDVPVERVLDLVAGLNGCAWAQDGSDLLVAPPVGMEDLRRQVRSRVQ